MAFITIEAKKKKEKYEHLENLMTKHGIKLELVSKMLCGNEKYLDVLLKLGAPQVCDSRVTNLQMIKELSPETETIYIKPPPKRSLRKIVEFADISFNTEYETIKL